MLKKARRSRGLVFFVLLLAAPPLAAAEEVGPIRLTSSAGPISVKAVAGQPVRELLVEVGRHFGLDLSFDAGFHDQDVAVAMRGVGAEEALDRICSVAGKMWVALDERSVVLADDTPQNRRRLEPLVVQTFYLEHARVQDMMTLLRSAVGVRSVTSVNALQALTVRDSAGRVALARRLVEKHDRLPGQLEVALRLVRLSPDEITAVGAGSDGALPARISTEEASALARAGRIVAAPVLSFASGEEAQFRIDRPKTDGEGGTEFAFELALAGRLASADGAVTLEAEIGAEVGGAHPEGRRLTSAIRLAPGETWALSELAPGRERLVVLLTPRITAPTGVTAGDREPIAAGTEDRLGLEREG